MAEPHLDNAARTLGAILRRKHPEYAWSVRVEGDGDDPRPDTAPPTGDLQISPEAVDQRPVADRQLATTTGGPDHDSGEQAA